MSYDVDYNSGEDGGLHAPVSETQDYELFYGTGGHGGPHHGFQEARRAALRHLRGSATEHTVYVVPRRADVPFGFKGAVRVLSRKGLAPEAR